MKNIGNVFQKQRHKNKPYCPNLPADLQLSAHKSSIIYQMPPVDSSMTFICCGLNTFVHSPSKVYQLIDMLERYKILTITHRQASLKELPHFAVQHTEKSAIGSRLKQIKKQFNIGELLYLSTCNRVMYLIHTETPFSHKTLLSFFESVNPALPETYKETIRQKVALYEGIQAIAHLFEVAASIDSLVVGEREILRQLRTAYEHCKECGLAGDHIRLAMRFAVETAKGVYANTRIGEKPISVVSLAIQQLLKEKLETNARILLIGAGQTNGLVAKFLQKHSFTNVTIFNRTLAKAQQLARLLNGCALPLSSLTGYRGGFDCLIACAASQPSILSPALYTKLLNGEADKKILIDLAIPNNISAEVADQQAVRYIEIENLRAVARKHLSFREEEVSKARLLLNGKLDEFVASYRRRQIEKAMQGVPQQMKAVRVHALNKVFKKEVENLDKPSRDLLERMLAYMEKQCISIPMKAARKTVE